MGMSPRATSLPSACPVSLMMILLVWTPISAAPPPLRAPRQARFELEDGCDFDPPPEMKTRRPRKFEARTCSTAHGPGNERGAAEERAGHAGGPGAPQNAVLSTVTQLSQRKSARDRSVGARGRAGSGGPGP